MITSEASASELAINSAITPAPSRHASADEARPSDTPSVCAPALANDPPRHVERAPTIRSRTRRRTIFTAAPGRGRVCARILVHRFIIYFYRSQTQNAGAGSILLLAVQIVALGKILELVHADNDCADISSQSPRTSPCPHADNRPQNVRVPPKYQLSSASRSAIAVVIRSIIVSVVSSGCMFGNSGEWHSVIVHIASACTICC